MSFPLGFFIVNTIKHMKAHQKPLVTPDLNSYLRKLRQKIPLHRTYRLSLRTVHKAIILACLPRVTMKHTRLVIPLRINLLRIIVEFADLSPATARENPVVLTGNPRFRTQSVLVNDGAGGILESEPVIRPNLFRVNMLRISLINVVFFQGYWRFDFQGQSDVIVTGPVLRGSVGSSETPVIINRILRVEGIGVVKLLRIELFCFLFPFEKREMCCLFENFLLV